MIKKSLWLGSSALVGVAMLASPTMAGSVGSRDALSVTLEGELLFQIGIVNQDVSATAGRGYQFKVDESEVVIGAEATSESGIKYGVNIELHAGAADGTAADAAWAFIESDGLGRIEMGDQDDATDQLFVESDDILVGRAGPDGDVADFIAFGSGGGISATGNASAGGATKLIYLTPRIGGFQLGGSLTPDTGESSGGAATADADNDGDYENVIGLGVNYEGKIGEGSFVASLTGEFGTSETATGAGTEGDLETIAAGATFNFGAYSLGASFVDFAHAGQTSADIVAGADSGSYYSIGGSYTTGPWGLSLNWFNSTKGNTTGISDTDIRIISFDIAYDMAPGWEINLSANVARVDNMNATAVPVDNDGAVVILSNQFNF